MSDTADGKHGKLNMYGRILTAIFQRHWKRGVKCFEFERTEILELAAELDVAVPKNVGDLLYSFRYRNPLPAAIAKTADKGFEWIIQGSGRARYVMKQVKANRIVPRENLLAIKIPDATPEVIAKYAQSDEQALLAKVRYNRLIDIFLGVAAYSLQNHLRTTVQGMGQIEIDEIYVALDKSGIQYIVPVQAKTGNDRHSVVQTGQDIACCAAKYPDLVCRAVSTQFADDGIIAMFELVLEDDEIKVVQERHYRLVPADSVTREDLRRYRTLGGNPLT
jgi:hypothetical protein